MAAASSRVIPRGHTAATLGEQRREERVVAVSKQGAALLRRSRPSLPKERPACLAGEEIRVLRATLGDAHSRVAKAWVSLGGLYSTVGRSLGTVWQCHQAALWTLRAAAATKQQRAC